MRLADHAADTWSQFGEDGIVDRIFQLVGEESRFCVEFGAADGVSCSNTKRLRDQGWTALLIEAVPEIFESLLTEASDKVECVNAWVTPENLDALIGDRDVDFMSVDIDGDDYAVFAALQSRPRVLCIEYNASIPPHVSLRQARFGGRLGTSARALVELANSKDYELVEVTKGNLLFVQADDAHLFDDYDRDLTSLYDYGWLTYLVTDYDRHPVLVGAEPPWGLSNVPFVDDAEGDITRPVTLRVDALCEAFEGLYGPALLLEEGWAVAKPDRTKQAFLHTVIKRQNPGQLIVVDISNHDPAALDSLKWISDIAKHQQYDFRIVPGGVIALFPRNL